MDKIFSISGNIVDVVNRKIFPGKITVNNGKIKEIEKLNQPQTGYILPGFVDSHIHIESSMLVPAEFARIAVIHGTVATVSDPHEIGNVMGVKGVEYMIESAASVPFKFNFGAPSCVPATEYETAGEVISVQDIKYLLEKDEIKYLAEVMNYPAVINGDEQMLAKISAALDKNKLVDGHAPGLSGENLKKYVAAGISTDHESFTYEEGLEKLNLGMKLLIREGSAARNFDALSPLIEKYYEKIMFCSDDKHPDELIKGHINELVKKAFGLGFDKLNVLLCACVNPVKHYNLDVGLLQKNDDADFILVDNLEELSNIRTYIKGELLAENGNSFIPHIQANPINNFNVKKKKPTDYSIDSQDGKIRVIKAVDGQLVTESIYTSVKTIKGKAISDTKNDILKICVVNRYMDSPVSIAFINGFGFKMGAIASSVAHDSHNIVVVGTDDKSICRAVDLIIHEKGGISLVSGLTERILPLPIAGIMSNAPYLTVAANYSEIDKLAKEMGSVLKAPFMTLSFMALLVIPELKLSDKGLFDGSKFQFADLFEKIKEAKV
ncbi:MAG: adenine deaminase [Bacteroidetes bacterium]|nr:adenine deaminase [Bacteroidota bacterium]HET6243656.1 adenine deaminase [Bacteroidia bacterium]